MLYLKRRRYHPQTDFMISTYKVGFCISGAGRLAKSAIKYSEVLGIQPSFILLDNKADKELDFFCEEHGIPFSRLTQFQKKDVDQEIYSACTSVEIDLLVLTFDKVLNPILVQRYAGRIINVHPSLLPAFIGSNPLTKTATAGVRFGGASIHEVVNEVDCGPVISQCVVALSKDATPEEIGKKIYPQLLPMFLQTIKWFAEGRIKKDSSGRIWVAGGIYDHLPISPSLENEILKLNPSI